MTLSKIQRAGMYAAAFATAMTDGVNISSQDHSVSFTAPAHAEGACLPGIYNPSRPVQPGDCFSSFGEFAKAMKSEGQQPILVGNRSFGVVSYGEFFTANADGSKGVNAEIDVPLENKENAGSVTVAAVYTNIQMNDVNASQELPEFARLNIDTARARNYCSNFRGACTPYYEFIQRNSAGGSTNSDYRIVMMAQTIHSPDAQGNWRTGKKVVVFNDMNDGRGDVSTLSSEGAITPSFGMRPVSYTQFANRFMTPKQP